MEQLDVHDAGVGYNPGVRVAEGTARRRQLKACGGGQSQAEFLIAQLLEGLLSSCGDLRKQSRQSPLALCLRYRVGLPAVDKAEVVP